ncbi:hypothetical protein PHLGIDRAFT_117720 [Phlebiopsis gigantea 11061_1 CR5-6]|uniref:Uncharacterized protein n=1 Tax=Phlebiopsis gigantea (strain 11061_1 CR5-6) TaxID=745531 RepID=A0A0C3S8Z4_PHLG1|nr:hypothetical protein PHLGIDRAFT_117720 [Phlebiopsis gigantea 11061_1 CR5-6]
MASDVMSSCSCRKAFPHHLRPTQRWPSALSGIPFPPPPPELSDIAPPVTDATGAYSPNFACSIHTHPTGSQLATSTTFSQAQELPTARTPQFHLPPTLPRLSPPSRSRS